MAIMRSRRKLQSKTGPVDTEPEVKPKKSEAPPLPEVPEADDDDMDDPKAPRSELSARVHREMVWLDGFLRRWLLRFMVIGTHLTVALTAVYLVVWLMSRGRCYDTVEEVPHRVCGLVLGTTPRVGSHDNQFFKARIRAAADLFNAGKVTYLIVSGDNSHNGYDEPSEMKAALIAEGVPSKRIYCDYAGFRTLDSVVRARRIFGQREFTVISQTYHNERALYIAKRFGMPECVALNAGNAAADKMLKQNIRELFARIMAVLDVEFLKTQPKFLGEKIAIGENTPPVDANPLPSR